MVKGNEIVNDDEKIATIMNRYFTDISKHIYLKANKISHREELVNILDTFKNQESVQRIKLANFCSYSTLGRKLVRKEILSLSSEKATKNEKEKCRHLHKRNNIYNKLLY